MLAPFSSPTAPIKGVVVRIMTEQTADETVSTVLSISQGIKNHTFSITTSAAVTGALILETAPSWDYAGVWSPLGGGAIDLSTISAGVLDLQFSQIALGFARGRITTVVGGGTVTLDYLGI